MTKARNAADADGAKYRLSAKAKAILRAEGLDLIAPSILPRVLPSIELVPGRRLAKPVGVVTSRIGGDPDLPPAVPWPADRENQPLSFLLQVALPELPLVGPLPSGGLLSFFYDTLNMPEGADCLARRACHVLYLDHQKSRVLARRPPPQNEDGPLTDTFDEHVLKPKVVPSFPDHLELLPNQEQRGDYLAALVNPDRSVFKMLGHPNTIQAPMQMECAMLARSLAPDASRLPAAMAAQLEREASQWLLLLQVDSSQKMQLQWGDSGRLYCWIPRKALEERRFDKAILLLQSH